MDMDCTELELFKIIFFNAHVTVNKINILR